MEAFNDPPSLKENKFLYTKAISFIIKTIEYAGGVLFFFSLCVASYEVFMRYVMNRPHDWGDELALTTMLWSVFLCACLALREGSITNIDILLQRLKYRSRTILEILLATVTTLTCAVLGWGGVLLVQKYYLRGITTSSSLSIPVWLMYLVLPISLFLYALVGVELLLKLKGQLVAKRKQA